MSKTQRKGVNDSLITSNIMNSGTNKQNNVNNFIFSNFKIRTSNNNQNSSTLKFNKKFNNESISLSKKSIDKTRSIEKNHDIHKDQREHNIEKSTINTNSTNNMTKMGVNSPGFNLNTNSVAHSQNNSSHNSNNFKMSNLRQFVSNNAYKHNPKITKFTNSSTGNLRSTSSTNY
jgi:hypothetical protein